MTLIYILILNIIRKIWASFKYRGRYQSAWIERISQSVSIKLYNKSKIDIGYNVCLDSMVDILAKGDGHIQIGDRVYMNRYCMISCHNKITIGKNCIFGPSVKIFDNNHTFSKNKCMFAGIKSEEIVIGENCWIASNVLILKGARIGNNCVIGAGCIINKDIPDNSIVRLKQSLHMEEIK